MDSSGEDVLLLVVVVGAVFLLGRWFIGGVIRGARGEPLAHEARPCPRCGRPVEVGVLDCPSCDFDFRTIGNEKAGSG
jgi:hypothetical protein